MVIDHRIGFVRVRPGGGGVIEVQIHYDSIVLVLGVNVHAVHPHGLSVHQDGHFAVLFAALTENVFHVINNVVLSLRGWRGVGGPLVIVLDDVGPGTP